MLDDCLPQEPMFEKRVPWVRNAFGMLLLGTVLVAPSTAHAQPYPNRPIKIIVPYAAGGAVDIVARTIAQPLAEALKQPVIVDNRPGASANIGMEMVAKAAPDGYTLLMASNGIATNMALFPNLAFEGRRPGDHRSSGRANLVHADQSGRGGGAYSRRPASRPCRRERQAISVAGR